MLILNNYIDVAKKSRTMMQPIAIRVRRSFSEGDEHIPAYRTGRRQVGSSAARKAEQNPMLSAIRCLIFYAPGLQFCRLSNRMKSRV
jgi:hypothetical protein